MSIHPKVTLPGQLQNTLLQPVERSPLSSSKSRPWTKVYSSQHWSPPPLSLTHAPLSQLLARSGKTSRECRKFHLITNPKESTAQTPQVLSFSSLRGRRRKPRAREQEPVFHGVRPSPKAVDGTVQAAGPPTSLPAPTPGPPNPHAGREACCTSQHLRVPGTDADLLLSTRGEGLDAGSDACLRPPASQVRTNPATLSLSDLTETVPTPSPGPSPEPGLLRC